MSQALAAKRLVIVGPARGSHGRDPSTVRRYRIARLMVEGERRPGDRRFEHLKRTYD